MLVKLYTCPKFKSTDYEYFYPVCFEQVDVNAAKVIAAVLVDLSFLVTVYDTTQELIGLEFLGPRVRATVEPFKLAEGEQWSDFLRAAASYKETVCSASLKTSIIYRYTVEREHHDRIVRKNINAFLSQMRRADKRAADRSTADA